MLPANLQKTWRDTTITAQQGKVDVNLLHKALLFGTLSCITSMLLGSSNPHETARCYQWKMAFHILTAKVIRFHKSGSLVMVSTVTLSHVNFPWSKKAVLGSSDAVLDSESLGSMLGPDDILPQNYRQVALFHFVFGFFLVPWSVFLV